ncbi:MAG: hypothetical protein HOV87_06720 [Catenulispora sp.]|nr:hypothetical protein [Catenulispora sp.]
MDGLLARPPDDESLFIAANLIALVAFRTGDVGLARRISQEEIGYALRRQADGPVYLMYALQPQINLLRIDGYGSDPDGALDGLGSLARLASGLGMELPELSISMEQVARLDAAGLPVRRVARTTHIVDTCKILYRHRLWERLAEAGTALLARYPDVRGTGPHHAAEALWLGAAAQQPPPDANALDGAPVQAVRLAFLQLMHHTAHLADLGRREEAVRQAASLLARADILDGSFTSPMTPLRWRASLADSLLRAGRMDLAEPVLSEVHHGSGGDSPLHRGIAERLGVPAQEEPRAGREETLALAGQVLDRLT